MSLQQNTDRILTTHVGSLPRPVGLLDLMKARLVGEPYDETAYDMRVREAVAACVRRRVAAGIGGVADGEQSKPGFFVYVRDRLDGFERRPHRPTNMFAAERAAVPEYYKQYFRHAMFGGAVAPVRTMVCVGPDKYRGEAALKRDIDNLKTAMAGPDCRGAFMPAVAPSEIGRA